MKKEKIFEQLQAIISDKLDVEKKDITLEKTLHDLKADSLDSVEVIMECEKDFDMAIPDTDMEKFTTIQSIVDYIFEHQPAEAKS